MKPKGYDHAKGKRRLRRGQFHGPQIDPGGHPGDYRYFGVSVVKIYFFSGSGYPGGEYSSFPGALLPPWSFPPIINIRILLKISPNDILERIVNERTLDLQKANREMEQEICERQRVQQALVQSETRFRTIIQEAAIGMAVVDKQGRLMQSNLALQRMLDYTSEKLQDMVIAQIIYPDDVDRSMKSFQELLKGLQPTYHMEERFIRLDGTVIGDACHFLGAGRRRRTLIRHRHGGRYQPEREAEEQVSNYQKQLQSLTSELSLTEERERRRLATDLHDHIGQALAISKIKLGLLQQNAASQDIAEPLGEVRKIIDQMIQDTRSLTFELSLPVSTHWDSKPRWIGWPSICTSSTASKFRWKAKANSVS